ncbi:hypothetical protein BDW_04565 [Bdellovibrio bacteriovorus W]|nr:hypothetical protein BDW_04565 [Bdellovibrio bacteriovorus W]
MSEPINPAIADFLRFLDNHDEEWNYGDFKRQGDLYLQRIVDSMKPLTHEQNLQLQRLRERLLWSYEDDVDAMRGMLKEATGYLREASSQPSPEAP